MNQTEEYIRQHFTFKNLREEVQKQCGTCSTCQVTKRDAKKYGFLSEKQAETEPWETLCVDLIGPYALRRKHKKALTLWCLTMIDPATGWCEMVEIKDKTSIILQKRCNKRG